MSRAVVTPHCATALICDVEVKWTWASMRPGRSVQPEPSMTSAEAFADRLSTISPFDMLTLWGAVRLNDLGSNKRMFVIVMSLALFGGILPRFLIRLQNRIHDVEARIRLSMRDRTSCSIEAIGADVGPNREEG